MAEKWAVDCAKWERGSAEYQLTAAEKYAQKHTEGWSETNIAVEVTAAGFSLSQRQVARRLKALARVEGLDAGAQAEAYATAYVEVNQETRGSHATKEELDRARGQIPSNTEGRVSMLEKLTDALDKDGWTPGDIAGVVHNRLREETKPKSKVEQVGETPAQESYRLWSDIVDAIEAAGAPIGAKARTKAEVAELKIQVAIDEGVNV